MITIKNLGCEGFRSFRDPQQTQELPSRGFFGIKGRNLSTGGSSGAGKSSITHLIAYLLGYSPFPATKQQSFLTKKPMQVWGTLESPDGLVEIRRGKETSIRVGDEPIIAGSVSKVNERLEKLFGVGPELLRNLTYRPQRKPGLFLSLPDADKKQFLSRVLGLEDLRKQVKDFPKSLTQKESVLSQTEAASKALHSLAVVNPEPPEKPSGVELDGTFYSMSDLTATSELAAADVEIQKKHLESVILIEREYREQERVRSTAEKEAIASRCHEYDLSREAEIKSIPEPEDTRDAPEYKQLKVGISYADTRIGEFQTSENKIRGDISALRDRVTDAERKLGGRSLCVDKMRRAQEALESLQKQECPTCRQKWLQASLKPYQDALSAGADELLSYEALEAFVEVNKTAIGLYEDQILSLQKEAKDFQLIKSDISKKLSEADKAYADSLQNYQKVKSAAISSYQEASREFRNQASRNQVQMYEDVQRGLDRHQAIIAGARQALLNAERKHQFCVNTISSMDAQYKLAMQSYDQQRLLWEKYKTELDVADSARDQAFKTLNLELDYASMIKGFLSAIFSEILNEISDETNSLMAGLPNVATTTISFETEKEKSDGTLDAAIAPVIIRDGNQLDLEANLSGGQLGAVELAVDLAVSRVVQRRTGSAPGWLILDESFTGFDQPVIESCLHLLAGAGSDLQIFIIDHSVEIKDMFTHTIEVVSENDVSRISS